MFVATQLFLQALESALSCKGFSLLTNAQLSFKAAQTLYTWAKCPHNEEQFRVFTEQLYSVLSSCLVRLRKRTRSSLKYCREKMQSMYHQMRISKDFQEMWQRFFGSAIGMKASPILYQYLSEHIYKAIVKDYFEVNSPCISKNIKILDDTDLQSLRYAAGYIVRKLKAQYCASTEITRALTDLEEDHEYDDESNKWIKSIDRGGLTYVSEMLFNFLCALEEEIGMIVIHSTVDIKSIMSTIEENDDVQFIWSSLSSEWTEQISEELFKKIVTLWVTIRGYSICNFWVEEYKRETKKSLQKSKGIRRKLQTPQTDAN